MGLGAILAEAEQVPIPSRAKQNEFLAKLKRDWVLQEPKVRSETLGAKTSRYFSYGATLIPHESKKYRGGEDAWVAND